MVAFEGTWIELIAPWFLLLGFGGGRLTASFPFVCNLMAVISCPDLWPHGFRVGLIGSDFNDHEIWAMMLLAAIAWGPGARSLDRILGRFRPNAHRSNGADVTARAG